MYGLELSAISWSSWLSDEDSRGILSLHKRGKLIHRTMRLNDILHYLQGQLERKYSVELRNASLADVAIRSDNKIMASGGWDGRYKLPYSLLCFDNQ